jgi:hypothetical protein
MVAYSNNGYDIAGGSNNADYLMQMIQLLQSGQQLGLNQGAQGGFAPYTLPANTDWYGKINTAVQDFMKQHPDQVKYDPNTGIAGQPGTQTMAQDQWLSIAQQASGLPAEILTSVYNVRKNVPWGDPARSPEAFNNLIETQAKTAMPTLAKQQLDQQGQQFKDTTGMGLLNLMAQLQNDPYKRVRVLRGAEESGLAPYAQQLLANQKSSAWGAAPQAMTPTTLADLLQAPGGQGAAATNPNAVQGGYQMQPGQIAQATQGQQMYSGGTPNFNEQTGQYTNQPVGAPQGIPTPGGSDYFSTINNAVRQAWQAKGGFQTTDGNMRIEDWLPIAQQASGLPEGVLRNVFQQRVQQGAYNPAVRTPEQFNQMVQQQMGQQGATPLTNTLGQLQQQQQSQMQAQQSPGKLIYNPKGTEVARTEGAWGSGGATPEGDQIAATTGSTPNATSIPTPASNNPDWYKGGAQTSAAVTKNWFDSEKQDWNNKLEDSGYSADDWWQAHNRAAPKGQAQTMVRWR